MWPWCGRGVQCFGVMRCGAACCRPLSAAPPAAHSKTGHSETGGRRTHSAPTATSSSGQRPSVQASVQVETWRQLPLMSSRAESLCPPVLGPARPLALGPWEALPHVRRFVSPALLPALLAPSLRPYAHIPRRNWLKSCAPPSGSPSLERRWRQGRWLRVPECSMCSI